MPHFISSGKKFFEKGDRPCFINWGQTLYEEKGGQTLYENIENGYDLVFFEIKLFYLIIAFYIFFTFNTQRINIRAI